MGSYTHQYGFRKGHSTSDGIMNFVGEVLQCFEKNFHMISVFIDLKKAFDTVPHSLILRKLKLIGIRNTEMEWFISYMRNRRQFTRIDKNVSEFRKLTVGVQQGSLLGVLLFQLLINDLPGCLKFLLVSYMQTIQQYLFTVNQSDSLKLKIQKDLDHLSSWLESNSLKLNVGKTKVMVLNREGLTPNIELKIDDLPIDNVQCFKFLGVILDPGLTFESHYALLHKKLTQFSFIIKKLSLNLPRYCLRTLYFAYFQSNLSYCVSIWFPLLCKKYQDRLVYTTEACCSLP